MTPDVVVDIGNSRIKWGRCDGRVVVEAASLPADAPSTWSQQSAKWELGPGTRWAVAGVWPRVQAKFIRWCRAIGGAVAGLDHYTQLPLRMAIDAPDSVGIDRLLNVLAAKGEVPRFTPALVVDVGTAVTVDLLDPRGRFAGGAILPGPRLMSAALHQHTAKLPDLGITSIDLSGGLGGNTADAIRAGVGAALVGGIDLLIDTYRIGLRRAPILFLTGGGLGDLDVWTFKARLERRVRPYLTLDGIRIAAEALP